MPHNLYIATNKLTSQAHPKKSCTSIYFKHEKNLRNGQLIVSFTTFFNCRKT